MQSSAESGGECPVADRLRTLGVTSKSDVEAFRKLARVRSGIRRGESIANGTRAGKHFTVLLEGLACMSSLHDAGSRQIYAFHYPGDFLGLHGLLLPGRKELEVQALTSCSIATIDQAMLEQTMQHHPALAQALWRAAMIEQSILRERLFTTRWPALQRVAHLLCEQLARLGAGSASIPLNQIEVADAAGLSVVHTNRIFHDLRTLGLISEERRRIEVLDVKRLQKLGRFDGRYLGTGESLAQWEVRIEDR